MSRSLQEVAGICGGHLEDIRAQFKPGAKITLVVRHGKTDTQEASDFILMDDDQEEAVAAIRRQGGESYPLRSKCEAKARRLKMPYFTLLACDNFTMELVELWIKRAVQNNVPYDKVMEAQALLEAMREWREDNGELCKVPD